MIAIGKVELALLETGERGFWYSVRSQRM